MSSLQNAFRRPSGGLKIEQPAWLGLEETVSHNWSYRFGALIHLSPKNRFIAERIPAGPSVSVSKVSARAASPCRLSTIM